jgi:hypothetical protein
MLCKAIFAQDRNNFVPYTDKLCSFPVFFIKTFMGINLFAGKHNIGTFDSPAEVLAEMNRILDCKDKVYLVTSRESSFHDWDILTELMRKED